MFHNDRACISLFVQLSLIISFYWLFVVTGSSLSKQCTSLASKGIISDYSVHENYIAMHRHSIHVLIFPPPHTNYFLNIPSKSGNHNWRGLFYRLWLGEAPQNFSQVGMTSHKFSIQDDGLRFLSPNQYLWLLVRNPYVRLLSVYLEKVRCITEPICETTKNTNIGGKCFLYSKWHMYRNYGSLTFEQYVIALTNHIIFDRNRGTPQLSAEFMELWVRSGKHGKDSNYMEKLKKNGAYDWIEPIQIWGDANVHYKSQLPVMLPNPYPCAQRPVDFMMSLIDPTGRVRRKDLPDAKLVKPVERAYRLCMSDQHTCVQSSGMLKQQPGRVRVLRLEEQEHWYVQFLQCFGIRKEEVVGEEWRNFEKQDCFYTPTGNCADALKVYNETELTSGGVHGHDTVSLMLDHYTPLAAELVYYLYKYDFERLGYKKWDGLSKFVPF